MTGHVYPTDIIDPFVEAVPVAMVLVNQDRIVITNSRADREFGYQRNEILGWQIERLIAKRCHPEARSALSAQLHPGRNLYALHKDGHEFPVEIRATPIETNHGPMLLLGFVDISAKGGEDARICAALKEKDVLLGEIHHRVKNNLQIVSSLLQLQASRVTNQAMRDLLRDSQNRIHSMALIHQTLYGSKDFENVNLAQFCTTLLPVLTESYSIDPARIAIQVDVQPVPLSIDTAVPCGLVVNELITNALKHAFPNRNHGEIRVALTRLLGNEVLLSVSDDGIGLPEHVDIMTTETIGLQLVGLLAGQLDGEISVHRSDPTRFSLRFQI